MSSIFSISSVTDAGRAAMQEALDHGYAMTFTSMKTGNGIYTTGEDVTGRTALKSLKNTYTIGSIEEDADGATVSAVFTNYDGVDILVAEDYKINEIGVFCTVNSVEYLYALAAVPNDDGMVMPAYDVEAENLTQFIQEWYIANSNDANITIDPTGAYVAVTDIVDNLTSESTIQPLSAKQGKVLKDLIDQGGSGGHVIVDSEGTELPQEDELQFGDGLSVVDDPVNGRTVVTVNQDLPADVVVGSIYTLGSGAHTGGTADPEFVVLDKTGDRALCISKGLYGGAWPGINQLDISSYLGDLSDAISDVYLPRGNTDGSATTTTPTDVYVFNGSGFVNTYSADAKTALVAATTNYLVIGASYRYAWVGTPYSAANAWFVRFDSDFGGNPKSDNNIIAPTFILDLSKVSLIDNVIVIKQSGTANQTDLTSIIATGSTNNTGAQIDAGRYFYLNGTYCKAKTNIASNATFTLNTNYEVETVGEALEGLAGQIVSGSFEVIPITSSSNIDNITNVSGWAWINGVAGTYPGGGSYIPGWFIVFTTPDLAGNYCVQFLVQYTGANIYFRTKINGNMGSWVTIK